MAVEISKAKARAKAKAQLELNARVRAEMGLLDFIPTLTDGFTSPVHLSPITAEIERAVARARRPVTDDPVRVAYAAPPRHGKTECVLGAVAWAIRRRPELTIGFITYAAKLSESKSAKARAYTMGVGVELAPDMNKLSEWRTTKGGGLLATGIGGTLIGQGLDIAFVDDPYKNRMEAESPHHRAKVRGWFQDVLISRMEPGGSVFVGHQRWNEEDLVGDLVKGSGYRHINLPAIDEDGRALWAERYPVGCELFRDQQKVPFTWESLYQGRPRPRGSKVFKDVYLYEGNVPAGFKVGIGLDFAYSESTSADYSVAVVLAKVRGTNGEAIYYVLDVIRVQESSAVFEGRLKGLQSRYPSANFLFRGSSIECEIAKRMKAAGLRRLKWETVHTDKLIRSDEPAKLWNGGQLLIPADAERESSAGVLMPAYSTRFEWVPPFTDEVVSFSGIKDPNDDQVDALGAAIAACDLNSFSMR